MARVGFRNAALGTAAVVSGTSANARGAYQIDGDAKEWVLSRLEATARYATRMGDDWERIVRDFLTPLGTSVGYYFELLEARLG